MDERRTLLLLRHAKSSWDEPVADEERPLAGRGVRDARAAGALLVERGWRPDLVLCSTSLRTRQTWDEAAAAGASADAVVYADRVYGATAEDLLELIRDVPDAVATLLVLGHGPGLPELAERLGGPVGRKFATCGLAALAVANGWAALSSAELLAFELPRG